MKKFIFCTIFCISTFVLYSQEYIIAPSAQNIVYCGIQNPLSVMVENTDCRDLIVTTNNGILKGERCNYYLQPAHVGEARVTIVKIMDNDTILIGSSMLKVILTPDPTAKVAGKSGGDIIRNALVAQNWITAELDDFDFENRFKVKSYSVVINKGEEVTFTGNYQENAITNELKEAFRNTRILDKVKFENIVVEGNDGKEREIKDIEFTIR
ncbi:MAG: hypothetical protein JXB49_07215 [Bacteroidales bacterium]|nr:hypothetical protein [Bacteroidales bacterium]